MFKLLRAASVAFAFFAPSAYADILWVGDSPQCTGSNTYTSVGAALGAALQAGADEIRLTGTLSYTGPGNTLNLANWNPATVGALTIAGGYSNCFSSQAGQTIFGGTAGPIIRVSASSKSVVTLQNLIIAGSTSLRGLDVSGNSDVFLENTTITENVAGAIVTSGAYLDMDTESRIQTNRAPGVVNFGGGLRCSGIDSLVIVRGQINDNRADNGGNIYVSGGCLVELSAGAQVNQANSPRGGGAFVDDGGLLLAEGNASRVVFEDNFAGNGGALYLEGTGQAIMTNTLFRNNSTSQNGSAIYAVGVGRGGSPQLVLDRAADCPFLISCSEFEGNEGSLATVYAANTTIQIERTLFEGNLYQDGAEIVATGTIYLAGADAFINRVGFIGNETYAPISTLGGDILIRHMTAVDNRFPNTPGVDSFAMSNRGLSGLIEVYNSIFSDTRGQDGAPSGAFTGLCNLVDDSTNWPIGDTILGDAEFINAAGGDLRQQPTSPGVDMCNAQPGAPANDRDLEFQLVPVNEFTNPQGQPGQEGGLWDAGVDEVYSTVGDDEFTLTVARDGTGTGFVISDPLGISCGSDCSETFFQSTLVTLTATPTGGSTFSGWIGCPLPNGNECFNTVDADRTITATFTSGTQFTLNVSRNGTGTGSVVSDPAGIICGIDCSEDFIEGTLVTLTANPDATSRFSGWTGCPLPNGNECLNTVDDDRTITATFDFDEYTLTIEKAGSGSGQVVSSPAGIDCGADCSEAYATDTLVTLTATPDAGNAFIGWIGCPLPNGNECLNTVDSDRTITARFTDEDVLFSDRFQD